MNSLYYFFEHPNEHVLGMVMVEAARQLLVACGHVYGNVPMNSNFMLLHMDLKFQRYVELNFPVRIHAQMNKLNKSKLTRAWSYFMATVTFYQKGQEVSKMVFEASVSFLPEAKSELSDAGKQMLDRKLAYHEANRDKALSLQDYKNKLNLKYGYNL